MLHEWWERVWTIQEATLPSKEPIIRFRGFRISYSTLISAMDAAPRRQDISDLSLFPHW